MLNKNVEFVCPTCQKCVFSANHDACIAQFLKQGKSSVKAQSSKKPNRNKLVDNKKMDKKPNRWISTGCSFSKTETSAASDKKTTSISYLRWIPTGKVFNTVGLRWIPTGKIFDSCTKTNNSDNHQDNEVETITTVDSQHPQSDYSCTSNTVICETFSSLVAGASTISEPSSSEGSNSVNSIKSFFQSSIFDFPFLL